MDWRILGFVFQDKIDVWPIYDFSLQNLTLKDTKTTFLFLAQIKFIIWAIWL